MYFKKLNVSSLNNFKVFTDKMLWDDETKDR